LASEIKAIHKIFNSNRPLYSVFISLLFYALKVSIFILKCSSSDRDVVLLCVCLAAGCLCFVTDRNIFATVTGVETFIIYLLYFSGKLICESVNYFPFAYTLLSLFSASFVYYSLRPRRDS